MCIWPPNFLPLVGNRLSIDEFGRWKLLIVDIRYRWNEDEAIKPNHPNHPNGAVDLSHDQHIPKGGTLLSGIQGLIVKLRVSKQVCFWLCFPAASAIPFHVSQIPIYTLCLIVAHTTRYILYYVYVYMLHVSWCSFSHHANVKWNLFAEFLGSNESWHDFGDHWNHRGMIKSPFGIIFEKTLSTFAPL